MNISQLQKGSLGIHAGSWISANRMGYHPYLFARVIHCEWIKGNILQVPREQNNLGILVNHSEMVRVWACFLANKMRARKLCCGFYGVMIWPIGSNSGALPDPRMILTRSLCHEKQMTSRSGYSLGTSAREPNISPSQRKTNVPLHYANRNFASVLVDRSTYYVG